MIMMNSNYQYSSHQFPPFSIDLNQDHQHYLNAHYFTTAITTATTTTSSSPSSSSSSPLPNYHIFINPPPPATQYSGEDTDPGGHLDYSSWGLPPPAAAAAAASFHQYHQPPQILLQKGGSSCMYDQEMVEVVDYNHNGSLDKMEKEMSYDVVSPKLRIMNQKKKKLTIKTNVKKPNNLNDVQSPSTLQLQPAAMTDNTTNTTTMTTTTSSNSPTAGSPTVRVCSDCNTTKTPLWRSGPQGPKSLCNACGIRQRKARRAMAAAAAAIADGGTTLVTPPPSATIKLKTTSSSSSLCKKSKKSNKIGEWTNKEMKKKRNNNLSAPQPSSNNSHLPLKKRRKFTAASRKINITTTTTTTTTVDGVCSNKTNKVCFDDLAAIFSNSNMINSYQRVFPQDEKEAAILLMALSYGLVRT